MFKRIYKVGAFLIGIAALHSAVGQPIPFYPQMVQNISDSDPVVKDKIKLKILISANPEMIDRGVSIGNVTACSKSECYRSENSPKSVELFTAVNGKAAMLAEILIPKTTITSIYLEDFAGAKIAAGKIEIINPLIVDDEYFGVSVLLIIGEKEVNANRVKYKPTVAVAGFYHRDLETIFYNPKIAMNASLRLRTNFSIPAGASDQPAVLSVGVHDTLLKYPVVDIYPSISLNPPGSLSTYELVRSGETPQNSGPIQREVGVTGVIQMDRRFEPVRKNSNASPANAAPANSVMSTTDECVSFLVAREQAISTALSESGTVYIRGCSQVAPFVHIAVSDVMDTREYGSIVFQLSGAPYSQVKLQTLPTLAPGARVAINGFTWTGDSGVIEGIGYANGFVQNNTTLLANNFPGGGSRPKGGATDGNKLVLEQILRTKAAWAEGSVAPLFMHETMPPSVFYIGSSTSIIKDGICANDDTTDRWSALGTTPAGKLIFVSSASSETTSAAELCKIFSSLGANYAIRLDGSTATSMPIDGVLVNPIEGPLAAIYGPARHIAYGVKQAYLSGQAGPTPVLDR